jgi:hypothetical protein
MADQPSWWMPGQTDSTSRRYAGQPGEQTPRALILETVAAGVTAALVVHFRVHERR